MCEDGCSVELLCKGDGIAVCEGYRPCAFYTGRFVDQLACLDDFYSSRLGQSFDLFFSLLPAYLSTEYVFGFGKRLERRVRIDNIPLYGVPEGLGKIS